MNDVLKLAREYWQIREAGEMGEKRSAAHNALMDAMRKVGIPFWNREHAAKIAHALVVLDDVGLSIWRQK